MKLPASTYEEHRAEFAEEIRRIQDAAARAALAPSKPPRRRALDPSIFLSGLGNRECDT